MPRFIRITARVDSLVPLPARYFQGVKLRLNTTPLNPATAPGFLLTVVPQPGRPSGKAWTLPARWWGGHRKPLLAARAGLTSDLLRAGREADQARPVQLGAGAGDAFGGQPERRHWIERASQSCGAFAFLASSRDAPRHRRETTPQPPASAGTFSLKPAKRGLITRAELAREMPL